RNAAVLSSVLDEASVTTRPAWQRTALLRGVEAGLSPGERIPGTGPRPTAPPAPVKMPAPPASLARMQSEPGDVGKRATSIAAYLDWPGKPASRAPAPPLTRAEQARRR